MQQSFVTDVAAREDRHRAEVQALHQKFTTDIATRDERHRTDVNELQKNLEDVRELLSTTESTGKREAEARVTAEADLERQGVELENRHSEISRLNSRNGELASRLATAEQEAERWAAEARRLDAELRTTVSDAERAATTAARLFAEKTQQLDETSRQLDDTTRRLENADERGARLSETSAAHDAAGKQLRQTIAEQRAERERVTDERDAARQQSAELEAQIRAAELEAEQAADEAARQLADAVRRLDDAEERAARVTGQSSVREATVEELRQALAEQQAEVKKASADRDAARRHAADLEAELADVHREPKPRPTSAPESRAPIEPARPAERLSAATVASSTAGEESYERPLSLAEDIDLVPWQREALTAWSYGKHRGIVEAVTGAGKTRLAHWAISEALDQDMKVLVIAPTAERVDHWYDGLRKALPINRVGKLAGARDERHGDYDVVVATAQDAAKDNVFGSSFDGLIVADQVHSYGTRDQSLALDPRYGWRLGLTAEYDRDDKGIATYVDPYFGGVTFRLGYDRALQDEAVAQFDIAIVALRLNDAEQAEYDALGQQANDLAATLRNDFAVTVDEADDIEEVAALKGGRPARTAARSYQKAIDKRTEIVARAAAKGPILKALAGRVRDAETALVFAQTQQSAGHVTKLFASEGCTTRSLNSGPERRLLARRADGSREQDEDIVLIAGSRGLDGGVDGPDVDLGILVGASRNKLQLIQRIGRVIRAKSDDRHARLALVYVEGTAEDEFAGDASLFATTVMPHAASVERINAGETAGLIKFLTPGA